MLAWLSKILHEKWELLCDIYLLFERKVIYVKNKFYELGFVIEFKEQQTEFDFKNIDFKKTLNSSLILIQKKIIDIILNLEFKKFILMINKFIKYIVKILVTYYNDIHFLWIEYVALKHSVEIKFYKCINKTIEFIKLHYTKKNIFEFRIYIYNKRLPFKKLRYKLNLIFLYFFCPISYFFKINKKFYYGVNIVRYHKKIPNFIQIDGKLKLQIKEFNAELKSKIISLIKIICKKIFKKYNCYFFNLSTLIISTNITNLIKKYNTANKNLDNLLIIVCNFILIVYNVLCVKIKNFKIIFNNLDTQFLNVYFKYAYLPINFINFIISDICRTLTYILIKLKKKWLIKTVSMYVFKKIIQKINYKLLKYMFTIIMRIYNVIYNLIASIIYFFISKTMYITIIFAYFYNEEAIDYLLYEGFYLYYDEIKNYLNSNKNIVLINFFLNENILAFLWPFACLQLILFWSRRVHDYYGNCLWTMTVFPMYLESYKIWYNKLICVNFLNEDSYEWAFLLKYNILQLFNYKIYNMYSLTTSLILIYLFIYFIRKEAYEYPYARFKKTRKYYLKYPIVICLLEIFRTQIILHTSLYIIYFNYKLNLNTKICYYIYYIKKNFVPNYYYPNEHNAFINWEVMNPCNLLIPNLFVINFLLDIIIILFAARWLFKYTREFLKIDNKFVASPIVALELFMARITCMYICVYGYYYWFTWLTDLRLYVYIMYYVVFSYLYFVFRFNIIPRKTMPWYFRNIVELWPSTYFNQWSTIELMYDDQVRYIALRFKLKEYKIEYKHLYKEVETWHKMIILKYQWQKDSVLRFFIAYCRIMSRKELMMREFNNYEYQGWYEDWEFNSRKINIYSWKLDIWDKPHIYIFFKTGIFANIRKLYFYIGPILERFGKKYAYLRFLVLMTKILDCFYMNKYIFIFEDTEDNTQKFVDWKEKINAQRIVYIELMHLKHLKRVLMEFSSGEREKTSDWQFPYLYEKEYKEKGWDMFKDPRIDLLKFDWRPKFKNLD